MTIMIKMSFLHPKGPKTRSTAGGAAINYDDNEGIDNDDDDDDDDNKDDDDDDDNKDDDDDAEVFSKNFFLVVL